MADGGRESHSNPNLRIFIKILGRKNLVFFKVLGEVRGEETEVLRGIETEMKIREKGRKGGKEKGSGKVTLANLPNLASWNAVAG